MTYKLPPLPAPPFNTVEAVTYRASDMRAYGLAARREALEECATLAELYDLGTVDGHAIAAAIRSLMEERK